MDGIRELQRALAAAGHDFGPCDGIWGRRSIAALIAFQSANGLPADGIAGAATLRLLRPGLAPPLVWLAEAQRLMGVRETPGAASTPAILDWAGALGVSYAGDDSPWCGLFVGHCLASTLPREPLPANPLAARGWQRCGRATMPGLGAILVFWRGARSGWQGHVGFYVGEDAAAYHVIGGNQGDAVSIARIARQRLLAARWPATAPDRIPRAVPAIPASALSQWEA